jgi:hypothetical protein
MADAEVEVDWAAEWYRERPADGVYWAAVDSLLPGGLRREVQLELLPGEPGREGLWAIAIRGESLLKRPGLAQHTLHVSLAFESELCKDLLARLTAKWGDPGWSPCGSTASAPAAPANSGAPTAPLPAATSSRRRAPWATTGAARST